jgi:DNA-binding FadR family transcriptional regulator
MAAQGGGALDQPELRLLGIAAITVHDQIAVTSGNPLIASFSSSIRRAARDTNDMQLRWRQRPAEASGAHRAHERLVAALLARDADRAWRAMATHFDVAIAAARRVLEQPLPANDDTEPA